MRLTTAGVPLGLETSIVGRIATSLSDSRSPDTVFLGTAAAASPNSFVGFGAVLTDSPEADARALHENSRTPIVYNLRHTDHLRDGDVVVLQPGTGFVRTLYRPDSQHNAIFMTERCNSNCLMCSQPPKDRDDSGHFVETNLKLIDLIDPKTPYLGLTGGEPTLLRIGLFRILRALRDRLPDTALHMLTNGRMFAWKDFTREFASIRHPHLVLGIPLYSDSAPDHDHIVQAKHAFDQTVMGLHQLARWGVSIEIRVVLHRLTIPRLARLAEFITRNFPFVVHVALMGLEPTGYTPRNREKLWIDPIDYQNELEQAVEVFALHGMNVSIYNSQLCLLRPSLWKFAKKSISDWKNIYLDECQSCGVLERCGGLFQSAEKMHSQFIRAFDSAVPLSSPCCG